MKKRTKKLLLLELLIRKPQQQEKQKFFGSFFQKRTASFFRLVKNIPSCQMPFPHRHQQIARGIGVTYKMQCEIVSFAAAA